MKKALPWISWLPILLAAVAIIATSLRPKRNHLFVLCAASLRVPLEKIAEQYRAETGVLIELQYGGSQQLLASISTTRIGDLFIPAADSYLALAKERGEIGEVFPLASMKVVLAVKAGNPRKITNLSDLLKPDVRVSLPDPESAATGKLARAALGEKWPSLLKAAVVTKPTVTDSANDVKLGSADACFVLDAVAAQYPELVVVDVPELSQTRASVVAGILNVSAQPEQARRFAQYLAAPERGGKVFRENAYAPPER